MGLDRYILVDGEVTPCEDLNTYCEFMRRDNFDHNRRIAKDDVGEYSVSTVFLGLDIGWGGEVHLFESMIFGGDAENECWRYGTKAAAEAGHRRIVDDLRAGKTPRELVSCEETA